MLVIRPISDLRNRAKELPARLELYLMLDEAEVDVAAGDRGVSVAAVRRQLKRARHAGRGGGRSRRARASQGAGA